MDEVGTPLCITIDFESVDESSEKYGTVTVRERDSKEQVRIKIDEVAGYIFAKTQFGY